MEHKLEFLQDYRDTERERCRARKREAIFSVLKIGGLVLLSIINPFAAIGLSLTGIFGHIFGSGDLLSITY